MRASSASNSCGSGTDDAAADLLAMALDDADRRRRVLVAHRDVRLAHRAQPKLEEPGRRSRRPHRLQAVAVEQRLDDVGFDLRMGPEDHGETRIDHAGAPVGTGGSGGSIFIRIIVISSC
jgi:hypothetical protein